MNLPRKWRDPTKRYGLAVVLASLALFIRGILPFPEGASIYQLPIVAVLLSAWYGGRGPGLVASLICVPGAWYWFVPPVHSFKLAADHTLPLSIFIALCLLLTEFGGGWRRAKRALEESERRFRLMAETVPEIIWFESVTPRRMLYISPRYEQIWGRPPGDLERDPEILMKAVHAEDSDVVRSVWQRWLAGKGDGRLDVTFRIARPDGETRWIRSRGTLIRDDHGKAYRASGIAADITEERRAEEALAKAQTELAHMSRLTTLGELTTSIAHEVSQPLGAIIARADACARWLAAEPPDMAEARAALDNIAADGKRAREVIARIRALTKGQVLRKESLDINHEILEVLTVAERELRSHDIALRTQLDRTLPHVMGDRVQLQQVLLNLIVNAMQAMSGIRDRRRELTIVSCRDGQNAVLVEVRDCGTGLDADSAERVFEAFYSTKADGIGIGLSISRSIIKAHGGRLWASPNEPHGALFRFSLPVAEKALS
jgi:PAS domain S-box-containing protein